MIKRKATREGRDPLTLKNLLTVAQKSFTSLMEAPPAERTISFGLPRNINGSVRDISMQLVSIEHEGENENGRHFHLCGSVAVESGGVFVH